MLTKEGYMNIEEYLEGLSYIDNWHPTGSRYICDPPVMDTDIDYVCYCNGTVYQVKLFLDGWTLTNQDDEGKYEGTERWFDTYRKDEYNLIITQNFDFFCRFTHATYVAKQRNLTNKQDRIALFQEILYGRK